MIVSGQVMVVVEILGVEMLKTRLGSDLQLEADLAQVLLECEKAAGLVDEWEQ